MKHIKDAHRASPRGSFRIKPSAIAIAVAACMLVNNEALSNPTGGQVVNGQASIVSQGSVLNITNTPGAIINWQNFSIGSGETTRFIQQNASSAVLNRILGQDPSRLFGMLQSNGKVFIVNPNGILFGQGAQVDVNGLVASSLDIRNEDFLAGRMNFAGNGAAGAVRNEGAISTQLGGSVYLIAPSVENSGLISAPGGDVILAAGRSVQLVDSAAPDVQVVVSAPEDKALNLGQVVSRGGRIGIYGALIDQQGIVNADSAVVGENGRIFFKASRDATLAAGSRTSANGADGGRITVQSDGTTLSEGIVEAKGSQGAGGEARLLGNQVALSGNAVVDVSGALGGGTALIGGNYQGKGSEQNAYVTYTGNAASIKADAWNQGNGGKVIVWADHTTRSYAHISARGGKQGGNGGFVETSGKHYLDVGHSYPDLGAPLGHAGDWLLDPDDITITTTADTTDTDGQGKFTPGVSGASVLSPSTIAGYLQDTNGGGNVIIDTTSAGSGNGDILVSDNISAYVQIPGRSLTMKAHGNITVDATIGAGGSPQALDINLKADQDNNNIGSVYVNADILSNGGNIKLDGNGLYIDANLDTIATGTNAGVKGNVTLNSTGSILGTGGTIYAKVLAMAANGSISDGSGGYMQTAVDSVSATNSGNGGVRFANSSTPSLTVGTVTTNGDVFIMTSGSDLILKGTVTAKTYVNLGSFQVLPSGGNVVLNASDGAIQRISGTIAGSTLTLNAKNGIGSDTPLQTKVSSVMASNSTSGDIRISNSGALTINGLHNSGTGGVDLDNVGALTVDTDGSVSTDDGNISLTAHSPLTVEGPISSTNGNIYLTAGATGALGSGDNLKINASVGTVSGSIVLKAGDNITGTQYVSAGGTVTTEQNLNTPTIDQCTVDPTLPGCSTVLPTVDQCVANPAAPGCTAVLPPVDQCVTDPTLPGCSVVLPTIPQCVSNPSAPGCSVVLPTLTQCIASPSQAGCSVVLPTVDQCVVTPTLAGCTAVIPSLSQCLANPALAGCSAVLPTLSQCISSPSLSGCSVVLPSLTQCITSPALAGCSAVLPTLATCMATPTLAGCSAILPSVSACTAQPTLPGCAVVLPPSPDKPDGELVQVLQENISLLNSTTASVDNNPATDDKVKKDSGVKDDSGFSKDNKSTKGGDVNASNKMYCN